jgi:Yip1 domain
MAEGGKPSSFIMGTINSAIALVKNPTGYISANKDAPATTMGIMVNYVAVLAAIPFIATLIGDLWYYSLFIPFGFAGSYVAYAFVDAFLTYILAVIGVYIIAMVIGMLAPTFGTTSTPIKNLKLAAFIYTPAFLIGALDIIPFLGVLGILGILYGLYILYLGLPIMLGTPKEKVVSYVVAVVIAAFVVYVVIGFIVGAILVAAFHAGAFL